MKRFFIAPLSDMQGLAAGNPNPLDVGEYHYIDLGSHGSAGTGFVAVVMMNERKAPMASWQALPSLLDAVTTLASVPSPAPAVGAQQPAAPAKTPVALMADVGAQTTHTGYTLAQQLATINPLFTP